VRAPKILALLIGLLLAQPCQAELLVDARSGRLLGSATAIGGARLVTNRHVVEPALRTGRALALQQGEARLAVRVAAVSDRLDLALLVAALPLAARPVLRETPPRHDHRVFARTPAGATLAGSVVAFPWSQAWGPALFVRLAVSYGASGGAVTDEDGALVGMITAAVNPDARQMQMLRSRAGEPPAGAPRPPGAPRLSPPPTVLVLPIQAVLQEVARLEALPAR
jgi:S1-C subfamily serine protease